MPVTLVFPETLWEALLMAVPLFTVLLGAGFLVFPGRGLALLGLEPRENSPDAVGEGRASFAGVLLAFGLCGLLLQEPKALQPGINTALGCAWIFAAAGYLLQASLARSVAVFDVIRVCLAAVAGIFLLVTADMVGFGLAFPADGKQRLIMLVAIITLLLGLAALIVPHGILRVMRLKPRAGAAGSGAEPRGILAGFYIAAGLGALVVREPMVSVLWLQLLLGFLWLFTGLGRILAMFLDPRFLGGVTRYNVAAVVLELAAGLSVMGLVLGFF
ncbi:MAG: hypothetical protein JJ891_01770 [Rhizobiaceae bacterium]|nr:hypothetical protein [Rhizobiaceae bacterium]